MLNVRTSASGSSPPHARRKSGLDAQYAHRRAWSDGEHAAPCAS